MILTPLLFAFAAQAPAAAATTAPAPSEIVAAAPAAAWKDIPADTLMLIDLADGRRITIQLAPQFAPVHIANMKALAAARFWDNSSIYRVQDNYVTQWGDATEKKPLPAGIVANPPAEYVRPVAGLAIRPLGYPDAYARQTGHADGWPVASDGTSAWLPHCYAMVGVGRNLAPDTGTGAELYTVIGHAPRHLERNIALVGRIIDGIEAMSALPRGTGPLGFYEKAEQRVPIRTMRIAAELPVRDRPAWQYLDSASPAFAAYTEARANRRDPFFNLPAGGADICNVPVPIRRKPAAAD